MTPKYVVICEDDQPGTYRYVGPFNNHELATAWARENFRSQSEKWMAVPLETPEGQPRTRADDLTVAYIAKGVTHALIESGGYVGKRKGFEGELEFMQQIIDHALALDTAADAEEGFVGVYVYEVAEPLGYHLARALMYNTPINVPLLITDLVAEALT